MPNLQGYIFYSLQHFTTKLCNFSKPGMLFQAMVIFLPILKFFKILSERGKVHSRLKKLPLYAWNDLETRRFTIESILFYKVLNGYTGSNLKESLIWGNTRQTNNDLRNSYTDQTLPKPNREFLRKRLKSFKCSQAELWNSIPIDATPADSVKIFRNIIRKMMTNC